MYQSHSLFLSPLTYIYIYIYIYTHTEKEIDWWIDKYK